jgi:thiamine kinase-like enzyme
MLCVLLLAKGLNAKDNHKEMFPVYGGKCLSRKAVHEWVEKFSQGRSKVADDETEVRKWLKQQSKDFYAAGFDALVKRWDKCSNVGRGYVEK